MDEPVGLCVCVFVCGEKFFFHFLGKKEERKMKLSVGELLP
jgi:hypothetical protein